MTKKRYTGYSLLYLFSTLVFWRLGVLDALGLWVFIPLYFLFSTLTSFHTVKALQDGRKDWEAYFVSWILSTWVGLEIAVRFVEFANTLAILFLGLFFTLQAARFLRKGLGRFSTAVIARSWIPSSVLGGLACSKIFYFKPEVFAALAAGWTVGWFYDSFSKRLPNFKYGFAFWLGFMAIGVLGTLGLLALFPSFEVDSLGVLWLTVYVTLHTKGILTSPVDKPAKLTTSDASWTNFKLSAKWRTRL
jgi:hypothetical protein